MSPMQPSTMLRLAAKALAQGGKLVSPLRIEWDCSGRCIAPVGRDVSLSGHTMTDGIVHRSRWGVGWRRVSARSVRIGKNPLPLGFTVGLTLKCRRCIQCRKGRQKMWSHRAKSEVAGAYRTWFGTLTLAPQEQFRLLCAARDREHGRGGDFEALDNEAQFRARVNASSPVVTKYLKRVRKQSGAPLRFLWVCEKHQSGDPHFHALVHETDRDLQVHHAILRSEWKLGFTKWKLVSSLEQATYLTKYLSKSNAARVRASLHYGQNVLQDIVPREVVREREFNDHRKADPALSILSSEGG